MRDVLHELVFSAWDPDFLASPAAQRAVDDVVFARFDAALRHSVPWLANVADLASCKVVEVGCGSGSSTAALAMHAREVVGIDIDVPSVTAARARCDAYGLTNVELHTVAPADMLARVAEVDGADIYVLYAVLEHQTYDERIATLRTLWDLLPAGGHIAVIETPNRFAYTDHHTAEIEFFHLLPDDLAFRYLDRVPRVAFRDTLSETLRSAPSAASELRIRWGLGASYHEFELAIPEPLDQIVVADGFEQEMVDMFPGGLDEELLSRYFVERIGGPPIGFARTVLNVVLRKPRSEADRVHAREHASQRRAAVAARFAPVAAPAASAAAPIAVIVPCVNAADRIGPIVASLRAEMPAAGVHVLDCGSDDATAERATAAGASVRCGTDREALVRATLAEVDADVYVMIDAQTADAGATARTLVDAVCVGHDHVVGVADLGARPRGLVRRCYAGVVRVAAGVSVRELQSGVRAFTRRYARSFASDAASLELEGEFVLHAHALGLPRELIDVAIDDVQAADASRHARKVLRTIWSAVDVARHRDPMRWYGAIGALAVAAAVALAIAGASTGSVAILLGAGISIVAVAAVLGGLAASRRQVARMAFLRG